MLWGVSAPQNSPGAEEGLPHRFGGPLKALGEGGKGGGGKEPRGKQEDGLGKESRAGGEHRAGSLRDEIKQGKFPSSRRVDELQGWSRAREVWPWKRPPASVIP